MSITENRRISGNHLRSGMCRISRNAQRCALLKQNLNRSKLFRIVPDRTEFRESDTSSRLKGFSSETCSLKKFAVKSFQLKQQFINTACAAISSPEMSNTLASKDNGESGCKCRNTATLFAGRYRII